MFNKRVVVSETGKQYLSNGQLWMYRNNLVKEDEDIEDGSVVDIIDENGEYIATGFYSANSHIVVRILTNNKEVNIDEDFWKERLTKAYNYRKEIMADNISNCRLVFGEADNLPGLIIDRYNNVLVSQISICGIENRKDLLYRLLLEILQQDGQMVDTIYQRNDINIRVKEGLPLYKGFYTEEKSKTSTIINENGVYMNVDYENGQKTGYFLDQKNNRLAIRNIACGRRVLDCFCHTGGFGINAALGEADKVNCVDVSKTALKQAYNNAKLNGVHSKIRFTCDDVFNYLEKIEKGEYNLIILDPPAFTKSRKSVYKAYNGYLALNQLALSKLKKGGILASCSCSRYMEKDFFVKMIQEAADKENVSIKLLSEDVQSPDHPISDKMKETEYLKFYIYKVI